MFSYALTIAQMRDLGIDTEEYGDMPDDSMFLIFTDEEIPGIPEEARNVVRIEIVNSETGQHYDPTQCYLDDSGSLEG